MKTLIFASSASQADELADALDSYVLTEDSDSDEILAVLSEFDLSEKPRSSVLVLTEKFATGWRITTPLQVFFMDGFTSDTAIRAEARARGRVDH